MIVALQGEAPGPTVKINVSILLQYVNSGPIIESIAAQPNGSRYDCAKH